MKKIYNMDMPSIVEIAIIFISVSVHIVCYIGLLIKIKEKWWGAFIPFYNLYQYAKIAGKPKWWIWLMLLPVTIIVFISISFFLYGMADSPFVYIFPVIYIIFFVFLFITFVRLNIYLAKSFNKGIAFGIGLTLIPVVFYLILALGESTYTTYQPAHHFRETDKRKIDIVQKRWNVFGMVLSLCLVISAGLTIVVSHIFYEPNVPEARFSESPVYEEKIQKYQYFNSIKPIRGFTADETPKTFTAEVSLGYRMGRTRIQTELIEKKEKIENIILLHLGSKKTDELIPRYIETLQAELKQEINKILIEKIDLCLFKELLVF